MTQLKDLAETRAAALALVGGGSRVYDAVHALTVRTGDFSDRLEEDTYAPHALPMDFAQYKRMAGSITGVPVPIPGPHPQSQPVPCYPSHSVTSGQSPRYADPSPPGPYSYPPAVPGKVYTLDDFQGSDDSFAGNPGLNRYGQRPAQSLTLNRSTISGSSRPQGMGPADTRPLPPSLSPRSKNDRHNFQFSDMTSSDHGLSFSLAHGGGGKPPCRGDGPLRGVYKERGGALHSPSPSRLNPEQALLMSDNESESGLSGERCVGSRSDGGYDRRHEGIDTESDRELKASAEEKSTINAQTSPTSDDECLSPVSKANKVRTKSPWISTFKSNGGNWNYTPPILSRVTGESLSHPALDSVIPEGEDFTGSPPKSPVDPAGKRMKEYRSVDEYFLQ
jgi:hypothetical protein